jgi:integration host factor subunit alpha
MPRPERQGEAHHLLSRTGRSVMIKADLVTVLRVQEGSSYLDAVAVMERVLAVLKEALQKGETVQIANFWTFKGRAKAERVGRNPATGRWLMIAPRKIVTLRPSRRLRDLVDPGETP